MARIPVHDTRLVRWIEQHRGTLIGIGAALLLQVGASGYGDTPDTRDGDIEIAGWFVAHRASVLAGAVLSTWALVLAVAVISRTDRAVRHSQPAVTTAAISAGIGAGALVVGMHLPLAGIAYVVAERDPHVAAALFELTLASAPIAAVPFSVALLSIAWLARRNRRTLAATSMAAGLVLAVTSTAWAYSGPLSPDVAQQVLYGTLTLWLLGSGVGEERSA